MRLAKTALALTAAAALTVGMAAPANAMPNPGLSDDLFTIHLAIPDPAAPTSVCLVDFTPVSNVFFTSTGALVGTAYEFGQSKIKSTGCGTVNWTAVVTVKDESPGHPTKIKTAAGFGNPATAATSQAVPYAVGVREVGIVTVTMLASSRIIDLCWEDKYEVNAGGNPVPISSNPC